MIEWDIMYQTGNRWSCNCHFVQVVVFENWNVVCIAIFHVFSTLLSNLTDHGFLMGMRSCVRSGGSNLRLKSSFLWMIILSITWHHGCPYQLRSLCWFLSLTLNNSFRLIISIILMHLQGWIWQKTLN